jgi:coproporphyrinogen III oxidase-like Fe-S oxidoreductase
VDDLALEALLLSLRTVEGIDVASFAERYRVDLMARNGQLIEALIEQGLLTPSAARLVPTLAGLAVADGLAGRFNLA